MNKKILLGLAVMVIGVIVLPQTISLFAGQHNFYDTISNPTTAVPCLKCHTDISDELQQPGTVNAIHNAMGCDQCHITAAPNSEGLRQRLNFHAAATAACIDCHNATLLYGTFPHSPNNTRLGCLTCHRNPRQIPGNFSALSIFSSTEVHNIFAFSARNSSLLKDANEACISCHTHVKVNIVWTRATTMVFEEAIKVDSNGNRTWIMSNLTATGVNITTTSG